MTKDPFHQHVRFDPSIQSEDIAFKPGEMVSCPKCARQNPPNRLKCLYCASDLDIAPAAEFNPTLRKLESWERGWNVILTGSSPDADLSSCSAYLSVDAKYLQDLVAAAVQFPIARVEDEREAAILIKMLSARGLQCAKVSDEQLMCDRTPVRISSIAISEARMTITTFNTREDIHIGPRELSLIVIGSIETTRVDSLEKRRRGKETKVLEEVATASDETVIDLYTNEDEIGYRIQMTGFDFSCLGDDKRLLATENMKLMIERLKEESAGAVIVDDYSKLSRLLDSVWHIESKKEPQGLRRAGFARKEFGTVETTNNASQFTKYSRMRRFFL